MNHEFRNRVLAQEILFGTIVTLDSIAIVEIIASSALDWIFIEAEHAPNEATALERMLVAAGDTPCLIRLPNHEPSWIKRALDLGAAGIIAPSVNTVAQARSIVEAARFSPLGARGIGVSRGNGYGYTVGDYVQQANAGTTVMVQAEHIEGVNNANEIANIEGVDGALIGPYDLSASMGLPGELDHPEVNEAIERVRVAFADAGKPTGIFGLSVEDAKRRIKQGFSAIVCGVDVMMFRQSIDDLAKGLNDVRGDR
jgi:2-dehydro-3-deoxyglucarate aldolase